MEATVVGWFPPAGVAAEPPDLTGPGSGVVVRFAGDPQRDEQWRYEELELVAIVQPE